MHLFLFRNLLCDLFLLPFYRNGKREERWEGSQGEDSWSVVHKEQTVVVNSNAFK